MVATVAGIHLGIDTHANRPAANTVPDGSIYSCSTHSLVYKSNFAGNSWATWATLGSAASGSITSSGYTQNTGKLLGRSTASSGAIEEITVGSGLTLSGGSLTASSGSANAHNENDSAVLVNATSTGDAGNRADHFPGTSLGGAWSSESTSLTAGPTVKYSAVGMRISGSNANHQVQAYTPSGAFRVEARLRGVTSGGSVGLIVRDSASGDGSGEAIVGFLSSSDVASAASIDGGTFTTRGTVTEGGWLGKWFYLAIERNGSNQWRVEFSLDRALWVAAVTTYSKTFTVAKAGIRLFGTTTASADFFDVVS